MKYRVLVTPPKAKRMIENRKLILTLHSGWEGDTVKEYSIKELGLVEFDVPDGYEWIYSTSVSDGNSFSVKVRYENDAKTREETIYPVPEKV